ncbi:lipoyl(octanoyl) transferase LipB [Desulfobotulus sp. H1]|uniref:Octanoyltransferase n=1 Tax=Desulfobotulus pelophilus TaxID=2823377 RepID=A0ABT3NAE2_9BACT|nr:lipoyl(octanoyl) transferase LipB [Desulfobotulus pelophilus]MCW7754436.1 lipoyl(octanoyl) transferase LipB [Desulfobotulus pelophilus]
MFSIEDLGIISFEEAEKKQIGVFREKQQFPDREDVLFFVEHVPVFSLGKRGGSQYFRISEKILLEKGFSIVHTERGGLVTFHGPGQLVAYPVFDIHRRGLGVRQWVDFLESTLVACCRTLGLKACGKKDARGLWVNDRKLGSVGVCIRKGISLHGIALNVAMDLTPFSMIAPCGMDITVTSLEKELEETPSMGTVKAAMAAAFAALEPTVLQERGVH